MKYFHELTKEQQVDAIEYTTNELKECLKMGIIVTDKPLSDKDLVKCAMMAAEGAQYTQSGQVVDNIAFEE